MKMVNSVLIDAPASVIFPWISDGQRVCQWVSNMERDETIEEKQGHVGSRFRQYYKERGKEIVMEGEVLAWEQDRRVKIVTACSMFEMTIDMTIDPAGAPGAPGPGQHRVKQDADIRLKGFAKVMGFLFGWMMRKQACKQGDADLRTLKRLCEAEAQGAELAADTAADGSGSAPSQGEVLGRVKPN